MEVASKERLLQQRERLLNAEWKKLEQERERIHDEAFREASAEISQLKGARQRAESQLEKVYGDLESMEQRLEQYKEFSKVLEGRSAEDVIADLAAKDRRVTQLENQLASSEDNLLRAENEELKKLRDDLKNQLDQVFRSFLMQSAASSPASWSER